MKKKLLALFDKKRATWWKKTIDDPREESNYCGPWRNLYQWGLKEDLITEGPKENPINENPKANPITVTPIDNSINEDPRELQDPQWLLRSKLTLFGFLVILYDRVRDRDKISKEDFGLGKHRFHATSYFKMEAKVFF